MYITLLHVYIKTIKVALINESKHLTTGGTLSDNKMLNKKCTAVMYNCLWYFKCTNKCYNCIYKVITVTRNQALNNDAELDHTTATYRSTCPTVILPLIWKGHLLLAISSLKQTIFHQNGHRTVPFDMYIHNLMFVFNL